MPTLKLTVAAVRKLAAPTPSRKQVIHWDETLRGFAVLCSGVSTTKSYIVQRDLPDGRTRRVTVGSVSEIALDVARNRAADILDNLRRGNDPKQKSRAGTLRQVLDQYLAARTLRKPSQYLYTVAVTKYLAPWADLPLSSITADMVEARHRSIAQEVASDGRYNGRTAANVAMRVLRLLWTFAQEREPALGPNPVLRLKRQWHSEPRRKDLVRAEDMPAFYKAIRAIPNRVVSDYLQLLLFTGLRKSEAASLTWADVDLQARTLHIPAERTKGKRDLHLPLADIVADTLIARRALGSAKFVFPSNSSTGHVVDPSDALTKAATPCGVTITVHGLRRTFVTIAASTPGVTASQIKALVNHAGNGDVTSGYMVFGVEALREPVQLVADRIKSLCGIVEPKGVEKISRRKST
jgi:integrase